MSESTVVLETTKEAVARDRQAYENWIRASRARAKRRRIVRRVQIGLAIATVAVVLILLTIVATAAPLVEPKQMPQGLKAPDAAPHRGVTLEAAQQQCEKHGGHWLLDEDSEGIPPGFKVIGCMFVVPKGAK